MKKGTLDAKKVLGGILVQDMDTMLFDGAWKCVTKKQPTEQQLKDMEFGFKVVKHTKSNAIVIVKDGKTLGSGPGQTNRIWSANMAIERGGEEVRGAVLASDAFFPFDDCVTAAAEAGISAIIQPGGSIRDEDSIKKCDELGIAMVFCGVRHFKH